MFRDVSEVFILVPALLGLKGNLEMTLASRLSTQVSGISLVTVIFTSNRLIKLFHPPKKSMFQMQS